MTDNDGMAGPDDELAREIFWALVKSGKPDTRPDAACDSAMAEILFLEAGCSGEVPE